MNEKKITYQNATTIKVLNKRVMCAKLEDSFVLEIARIVPKEELEELKKGLVVQKIYRDKVQLSGIKLTRQALEMIIIASIDLLNRIDNEQQP